MVARSAAERQRVHDHSGVRTQPEAGEIAGEGTNKPSNQLAAETFMPMMVEAFHDGLREAGSLSRWLLATLVPSMARQEYRCSPLSWQWGQSWQPLERSS